MSEPEGQGEEKVVGGNGWHIVTGAEKERLRQIARDVNARIGIAAHTDRTVEEIRASQLETMRQRGFAPEDRIALREILIARYPDEWEEVLREHGFEVK